MSKQLDEMEALCLPDRIKDFRQIENLMHRFLSMTYEGLAGDDEVCYLLCKDLSNHYALKQEEVKKRTLGELLMFIGYEPGLFSYELTADETWFYEKKKLSKNKRFLSSFNCYLLAQVLVNRRKEVPLVDQLFRIDFECFLKWLWDLSIISLMYAGLDRKSKNEMYSKKCSRLTHFRNDAINFVIYYHWDHKEENHTLGDVIETAVYICNKKWFCGITPLNEFVQNTVEAHQILLKLFMDCIRSNLVFSSREGFFHLWDECKVHKSGNFKDEVGEIDYRFCYE